MFIVGTLCTWLLIKGWILRKNRNKYLVFASTDKNKEVLTKYTELWDGIKNLIEKINENPGEYEKDFMKIKLFKIIICPWIKY